MAASVHFCIASSILGEDSGGAKSMMVGSNDLKIAAKRSVESTVVVWLSCVLKPVHSSVCKVSRDSTGEPSFVNFVAASDILSGDSGISTADKSEMSLSAVEQPGLKVSAYYENDERKLAVCRGTALSGHWQRELNFIPSPFSRPIFRGFTPHDRPKVV